MALGGRSTAKTTWNTDNTRPQETSHFVDERLGESGQETYTLPQEGV